jgi:hypothetical protein
VDFGIFRSSALILVYDLETYATGFADPSWVPQVVTCVAWKWLGDAKRRTCVSASTDFRDPNCPMPHLDPEAISKMIDPFLEDLSAADAVCTYNGMRFDNPVLNGTMWLSGRAPLDPILTYDLHDFGKVKGVKKGLDNTAVHLGTATEKLSLNHAQWQEGYLEPGWGTIKARAKSDVVLTEEVFRLKQELGWLKPPKRWKP